jgi:hypothetical protein
VVSAAEASTEVASTLVDSGSAGPACWSDVMTLGKIFGIFIFLSLVATGATLAEDISKNLTNPKNLANSKQVANVQGDKVPPKGAAASVVVHHVGPEAPIVMGRSVSLHHKTKLHHVKMKPLDSNENSTSADGSQ